jgi:hypothetical protein
MGAVWEVKSRWARADGWLFGCESSVSDVDVSVTGVVMWSSTGWKTMYLPMRHWLGGDSILMVVLLVSSIPRYEEGRLAIEIIREW